MTTPGSIIYTTKTESTNTEKPLEVVNATPWNDVSHSPGGHVVAFAHDAVASFEMGDYIGAFTPTGLCAGMTVVSERGVGLVLNGDDVYTTETDGFVPGEGITYKLYKPKAELVFDLEVQYDPSLDHSGVFDVNSMSAITGVNLTGFETLSGLEGDISIFPNPSPGIFNIEDPDSYRSGDAGISVFNAFGEEIMDVEIILPDKVDLSNQPKGIYFIRISTDKGIYFEKLVIN